MVVYYDAGKLLEITMMQSTLHVAHKAVCMSESTGVAGVMIWVANMTFGLKRETSQS